MSYRFSLSPTRTAARVIGRTGGDFSYYKTIGTANRSLGVVGVVDGDFEFAFGFFGHEVGADEGGEVAIEDFVDVADAEFRAVILDQAIGLHDVRTDLAAEGNFEFGFVEAIGFVAALLNF